LGADWLPEDLVTDNTWLYVGVRDTTSPYALGRVIRVDLTDFTIDATHIFNEADEKQVVALAIDGNYIYAGLEWDPASVIRISRADFATNQTLWLPDYAPVNDRGMIVVGDKLFVATETWGVGGRLYKINLTTFTFEDRLFTLQAFEDIYDMDRHNGFVYAVAYQDYASPILKIDPETLEVVDYIQVHAPPRGEYTAWLRSIAIDHENHVLYALNEMNPSKVIKVNLTTFKVVDILTLPSGLGGGSSLLIVDNYLYVVTSGYYWDGITEVSKIDLTTFSFVANITLSTNWENFAPGDGMAYHNGLLYIAGISSPYNLYIANLTTLSFSIHTALPGPITAIEIVGNHLYGSVDTAPGKVFKLDLPNRTKVIELTVDADNLQDLLYAPPFLYTVSDTVPAKLIKIDIRTFKQVDTVLFEAGENYGYSIEVEAGYVISGMGINNLVRFYHAAFNPLFRWDGTTFQDLTGEVASYYPITGITEKMLIATPWNPIGTEPKVLIEYQFPDIFEDLTHKANVFGCPLYSVVFAQDVYMFAGWNHNESKPLLMKYDGVSFYDLSQGLPDFAAFGVAYIENRDIWVAITRNAVYKLDNNVWQHVADTPNIEVIKSNNEYALIGGKDGLLYKYDGVALTNLTDEANIQRTVYSFGWNKSHWLIGGEGTVFSYDNTGFQNLTNQLTLNSTDRILAIAHNGEYWLLGGRSALLNPLLMKYGSVTDLSNNLIASGFPTFGQILTISTVPIVEIAPPPPPSLLYMLTVVVQDEEAKPLRAYVTIFRQNTLIVEGFTINGEFSESFTPATYLVEVK